MFFRGKLLQKMETVLAGKIDVQQHQIGIVGFSNMPSLCCIAGFEYVVILSLQCAMHAISGGFFIVHY